jgi:transcriptional repressor NrdR
METPRQFVVKKDGRREQFSREKVLAGLERACEKRPVSQAQLEDIVAGIERDVFARGENEVPASLIGEKIMEALRGVDKVAYIRFASVYRAFRDVESFQAELADLLAK